MSKYTNFKIKIFRKGGLFYMTKIEKWHQKDYVERAPGFSEWEEEDKKEQALWRQQWTGGEGSRRVAGILTVGKKWIESCNNLELRRREWKRTTREIYESITDEWKMKQWNGKGEEGGMGFNVNAVIGREGAQSNHAPIHFSFSRPPFFERRKPTERPIPFFEWT
ncbi:hypothetical protein CAEBREN_12730 [Caenorhabditis brenneri]|uniref:Uncharacterized protein n=1 Tax=Caenorhabditis brenneri TaxID=135651 RepID=G0NJS5_CAEBE|nr:hypothetical protein CAEBREN_12730 [Caenorhabditis brenneri]